MRLPAPRRAPPGGLRRPFADTPGGLYLPFTPYFEVAVRCCERGGDGVCLRVVFFTAVCAAEVVVAAAVVVEVRERAGLGRGVEVYEGFPAGPDVTSLITRERRTENAPAGVVIAVLAVEVDVRAGVDEAMGTLGVAGKTPDATG